MMAYLTDRYLVGENGQGNDDEAEPTLNIAKTCWVNVAG